MSISAFINNSIYEIDLGRSFRNKDWANEFGKIQKAISTISQENFQFNSIDVNLSYCEWIDPLPLLSLIISLNEFKHKGGLINVYLPLVNEIPKQTDKVVKFIYEEGFLNALAKCCKISDAEGIIIDPDNDINNDEKIKKFKNVSTALYYTNCSLLQAEIFEIKNEFNEKLQLVDKWVEDRIKIISTHLIGKIPPYTQSAILYRITILLTEMIQNIISHAYEKTKIGFAGVYIRFRNGLDNNSLSIQERDRLDYALNEERAFSPRLEREYLNLIKGCVEVFVIDSGVGFTECLRSSLPNPNVKYPFRIAFKMVFSEGKRKNYIDRPDSTYQGGLYYIGEMLRSYNDYLCGRDENEWVGGKLPISTDNAYALIDCKDQIQVNGLAWIVRLSWKNETEIDQGNWTSWNNAPIEHPAYKELEESKVNITPYEYCLFDYRFDLKGLESELGKGVPKKDKFCMFLPPENAYSKFTLWQLINDFSEKFNSTDTRSLIIADIPEHEKHIYTYVFNKINRSKSSTLKWVDKFNRIILISRRLSVCILNRVEENNHLTFEIADEKERKEYFQYSDSPEFMPDKSIAHFIAWIRAYDSSIFWSKIKMDAQKKQFYVNEEIKWSNKDNDISSISGYLDFAQTCTDTLCMNIYKISLERTIGIFNDNLLGKKLCEFINIDILTKRITDECNSIFFNEPVKSSNHLMYVGSVYVSGKSKKDAMFYMDDEENILNIHFFLHKSSLSKVAHLLNWPKEDWLNKNFKKQGIEYERVGRTHVIAKFGYKSFPIPRFDKESKESAYYRNPRNTYKDWQDEKTNIISFGHFAFEGNHDLIKINLSKLINESFLFNDELFKFLVSEFFISLGGRVRNKLTEEGLRYWNIIQERMKFLTKNEAEVALIVYANNSISSLVVDRIKKCLIYELQEKIFPLVPINKGRVGSSLLISPLVFEPIEEILKRSKNKKVLLFDTSIISGRTREELKHLLISWGAEEIKTLSITDRYRLPFKVQNSTKHKAYWRLDVPRLGNSEMCPICKAIELAENFKTELASEFAIERINQWNEYWSAHSYFNSQSDHGINPTPINPTIEKKFGIEYNVLTGKHVQIISDRDKKNNTKNEIELKNSLGITLYATEIHSMTSRDDLALKLCESIKDLTAPAKIQLLSTQLLLFPNEYAKHIQYEMVKVLYDACNEISYSDNYTALASLVIIIQNRELHQKLFEDIRNKGYSDIKINNIDLEIAIAYIYNYHIKSGKPSSEKMTRLLKFKDEETILSMYKQLHSEIYNEYGKIHNKPLIALYEKNEYSKYEKLKNAINSISKLSYLLNKINEWLFRIQYQNEERPENLHGNNLELLKNYYSRIKNIISSSALDKEHVENDKFKKEFEKLVEDIQSMLIPSLISLHKFLFCPIKDDRNHLKHPIKDEVERIINSVDEYRWMSEANSKNINFIGKPPKVKISKNVCSFGEIKKSGRSNAWMIYDQIIEEEIRYTISNAIYATKEISDIWSVDADNLESSHMWINVTYLPDKVRIEFANASELEAVEIKKRILSKKREGIIHLIDDLKGSLDVENIKNISNTQNVVKVILNIPYI